MSAWWLAGVLVMTAVATRPSEIRFEDVTQSAGVSFVLRSGSALKPVLVEAMSGGVAIIDIDNDNWPDLYFVNGSTIVDERQGHRRVRNYLYRNLGDGRFADVTDAARVTGRGWGMGACVGDVDNNGFDDLFVVNLGPDALYINNGDGTFRDSTVDAGISDDVWGSSCGFADYDRDGDLDLYVSNYMRFDSKRPQILTNDGVPCDYRGLRVPCGPRGMTPLADRFYENVGKGRFVDAAHATGLDRVQPSYGMAVVWGDYDNDGDQDLFVANDSRPNFLFRNNGNKTFTDVALAAGVALSSDGRAQDGMGADFGDVDNDGDLDLIYTAFAEDYNPLFVNDGGVFTDGSFNAGIIAPALPFVGWGVLFADLDLDGYLDIPIANGHLYPQLDQVSGVRSGSGGYRQRNVLFRNLGDRRFRDIGEQVGSGFGEGLHSSRGLVASDLNNDGLIDLVMTHLDAAPSVLINRSGPARWLAVKIKGGRVNPSGLGARVTLKAGGRTQMREVKSGGSFQSQSDLRVHFGLGQASHVDEVTVRWPDGRVTRKANVEADQMLTLEEPAP